MQHQQVIDNIKQVAKKLVANDYDMTYPFRELGWKIGEEISPHIYTKKQWSEWTFLPYYKNVEQEKIVLV